MNPILVTASTALELSQLISGLSAAPLAGIGHLQVYCGSAAGSEVLLALTGIGKVNAACAATALLERFAPRLLINTGCGGACAGSGLSVGDLALASVESFPEEGVLTPGGWRGLDLIGIPVYEGRGERVFNEIPLCGELAAQALESARRRGFRSRLGPFHTVSCCSGTAARGAELLLRYPGICENMEGGAVAQVALIYGVPCLEVRGISNLVEDRDLSRWDLKQAVATAQRFLLGYLEDYCLDGGVS
jgi:futalosine hydrolase